MGTKMVSICLLFSIIAIGKVQAACFDCSKVKNPIYQMICSNKELSDADEILEKEFKTALQTYPYKEELGDNQYNWANFSDEPCWNLSTDATCLLKVYRKKIDVLKTQYLTYFYGGDKYTGVYKNKNGGISIILIPGNKIKYYISTLSFDHTCGIGNWGKAIATFIDKNHAVYLDETIEDCSMLLKFAKNRVTVSFTAACAGYCGTHGVMQGVYFKKSNKPNFSEYLKFSEKKAARLKREERIKEVSDTERRPDLERHDFDLCTGEKLYLYPGIGSPE